MLAVILKIVETAVTEITKLCTGRLLDGRTGVCRELMRLFVVTEELLQVATRTYADFDQYVADFDELASDASFKQKLRHNARLLLDALKRFEDHLKSIFTTLKLIGGNDLVINLVKIPESSYSLFKSHFVEDIAPKCVSAPAGDTYVLRLVSQRHEDPLVTVDAIGTMSMDLDALFDSGALRYEMVDFNDRVRLKAILDECSEDVARLKATTDTLAATIKEHCKLESLL